MDKDPDPLAALQRWYLAQCDGVWENQFGVKIETLDNPGWLVKIDLAETALSGRPFPAARRGESAARWLECAVEEEQFVGAGGAEMLGEIVRLFLAWAHA